MIFRFDDVCANTDMVKLNAMAAAVRERCSADVQYSVSVMSCDMSAYTGKQAEFAFKSVWKAYSDHRRFFGVNQYGIPPIKDSVKVLSHGLVHIDHRQMHRDAQEMSILVSCSVLGANTFVPPFNKWNADTEAVCQEHGIKIMKFEDGWLGAEYNVFNVNHELWYTHSFNWTLDKFTDWLGKK